MVKEETKKTKSKTKAESIITEKSIKTVDKGGSFGKTFSIPENDNLLSQYIRYYLSRQRRGNAQAKTRGEVSGSGRKPWKQKHTGRARVGDIRNPVWRHGGVSHGPLSKDWSIKLPSKMRDKAFVLSLSGKVKDGLVYEIDKLTIDEGKTKVFLDVFNTWGLSGKVLIVTAVTNRNLLTGARNVKKVTIKSFTDVSAYDVISSHNIVLEEQVLKALVEKYA